MAATDRKYASLFAVAYHDKQVMADLTSGDQKKVHAVFKKFGIAVPDDEVVNVMTGNRDNRFVLLPPKAWLDAGNDSDAAGKCYGPACGFLCGPF